MKTIQDINKEITDAHKIMVEMDKLSTKKAKNICKRLNKRIKQLKFIKLYLESNPRPEFVQNEKDTVLRHIASIDSGYVLWAAGRFLTAYKDPKKAYTNDMGLPALKEQLKTLKYILD